MRPYGLANEVLIGNDHLLRFIGFALARELNRPYLLRAPEWGLKLVLGSDPTESLLTTDAYVIPEVLAASGFSWTHESAEDAVRAAVGQS